MYIYIYIYIHIYNYNDKVHYMCPRRAARIHVAKVPGSL